MIRNTGLASTLGPTGRNTKVTGGLASSTVKADSQTPKVSRVSENGSKANESNGYIHQCKFHKHRINLFEC